MSNEVILCNSSNESVSVFVTAKLDGAKLSVNGVDYGKSPKGFFGGSEYEYWYTFDEENTDLLFRKIGASKSDPLAELKKRFSGMEGCRNLREYCDAAGIKYRFESWT